MSSFFNILNKKLSRFSGQNCGEEMGEGVSKNSLTEHDLEVLHKVSKKPKEEIQFWFEHFLNECPSGKLDKEQFVKYYSSFRKNERVEDISKHAFNAFDAGYYIFLYIFFFSNILIKLVFKNLKQTKMVMSILASF